VEPLSRFAIAVEEKIIFASHGIFLTKKCGTKPPQYFVSFYCNTSHYTTSLAKEKKERKLQQAIDPRCESCSMLGLHRMYMYCNFMDIHTTPGAKGWPNVFKNRGIPLFSDVPTC
jgi:hypothetical protein